MIRSWRSRIQEAEQALSGGRLQTASRLIRKWQLWRYSPGQHLASRVFAALMQRAQTHANCGDLKTAWDDFDSAKSLIDGHIELKSMQQSLLKKSLGKVDHCLTTGATGEASQMLHELARRQISGDAIRDREETARHVETARRLAREGKFAAAERCLATAAQLSPGLDTIEKQQEDCRTGRLLSAVLTDQLRQALIGDDWRRSLSLADRLLELAPDSKLARDTRRRASEKVESKSIGADSNDIRTQQRELADTQYWQPSDTVKRVGSGLTTCLSISETTVMKRTEPRFLLWVDAVGGFLVCLSDQITIGQAVPDSDVDIPILGDLSRRHAMLRRTGEDYLIDPHGPVRINGLAIRETRLLSDGDEIELGEGVGLRYRRPHALSATARLELVSRHKTQPSADGILLMAESCVLGPNWNNHVVCRDWSEDVVLYRHDDKLFCRTFQEWEIDGEPHEGPGQLNYNSHVSGEDFSMSLEEI